MRENDKQLLADKDWWQELERYLPWQLYGWTGRSTASFFTTKEKRHILELRGNERDQIIAAITKRKATHGDHEA